MEQEMIMVPKAEYESLKAYVAAIEPIIEALQARITELEAKNKELEARLKKNSKNSNKPPSSDGARKPVIKNSRIKTGKPSGGQRGHKGTTKMQTATPDKVINLVPIETCDCGGKISVMPESYEARQVEDIVPIQTITIEYRAQDGTCASCGKVHKSTFPEGVNGSISYGENLRAIITYLLVYQLIPFKRTTELIEDMAGVSISQGTVLTSYKEAYEKLAPCEAQIKEEIINADTACFDESGQRVCGTNHWLHSASTEDCTFYSIHEKRGRIAMDEIGILPNFRGTAVHDHWSSYYTYDQCAHAECNEHHLRHLKYLFEDLGEAWAGEMAVLLQRINRHVKLSRLFGAKHLSNQDIEVYEGMYRSILKGANEKVEAMGIDSRRMVKRLIKYEQETLLFMLDFSVPFTNNLAERDIRMPKAKQKISGGFRSKSGANYYARIRGFVSTVKKRGKRVIEGLKSVFNDEAYTFLFGEPPITT